MKKRKKKKSGLGEIFLIAHAEGEDSYSSVRIWSEDQCLLRIKTAAEREKDDDDIPARFDSHQFQTVKTKSELAQHIEYCDDEDTGRRVVRGFFVGVPRGYRPVEARAQCPDWILNTTTFREFISKQENKARSAATLYLFYRCHKTDADIAELLGDSEGAIKKYRQRLMLQGYARFRKPQRLAA